MRSLEQHVDVGAYALGVLDEAEAFRFEDHLMECPRCAAQVTEFGPTTRQLMLYRRATPRSVHPFAGPGPRLLDKLLGEVAARRRAVRRRFLYGLAASVVVALAGPALMMAVGGGEGTQAVASGQVKIAATDAKSGVWARVTAADKAWGADIEVEVKDGAGPRSCRLVIVGRDGSEQTATGWMVPDHDARPTTMHGGTAMHTGDIAFYDVREGDQTLLRIPAGS
ncbi:zf-HC2 domain-containing protein [Streptomyces roseirectus]|uniref:Zf-HC2 domain-containing protein n=1 Tax=Streptomyces roseirectus TaxID=2768066 RepID=A0A7H0IN14_9ACTN|nr:zf-HC2 domain-containing protein [Streptomyces roseirectus]QNP74180.1 zf-HC2 domain-containing protein [Streptomyces roseirectus]